MILERFIRYQRPVAVMLLYAFSLMLFLPAAYARMASTGDGIVIKNIRWEVQGENVLITYDLYAPLTNSYEVSVKLRRETDKSYAYQPKSVSGSIGKGKFAGPGQVIRWAYLDDIPEGLTGNDYYFEITAKQAESEEEGGISAWWWILGGAAIAGGVAVFLLGGDSGGGGGGTTTELPTPPVRPAGN